MWAQYLGVFEGGAGGNFLQSRVPRDHRHAFKCFPGFVTASSLTPWPTPAFRQGKETMNSDKAIVVRTYVSEAAASIAASCLESEGIEAHIQKDDCGGAYPALQMSGGVRLLVKAEDLEDAEKILDEMEAEDSEKVEPQEEPDDRKKTGSSPLLLLGLFLLGLAIGYFLSPEVRLRSNYTGVEKADRNKAGVVGAIYHYVDGQLARAEEDRNYDGKPDAWHKFVAEAISTVTYDDNFDGQPDRWATYKDAFDYVERVDTDFDGKPDATIYYVNGLRKRVDWHPRDAAIIERREIHEHGVLKEALVDTDLDGIFDLKITYDRYERPIEKTKVWIPN